MMAYKIFDSNITFYTKTKILMPSTNSYLVLNLNESNALQSKFLKRKTKIILKI